MDREWSTSVLGEAYRGWDWFALHLDDGRDLMLYQLRRVDGRTDDVKRRQRRTTAKVSRR